MSSFDKVQFRDIDDNYQGQRIDNFLITLLKGVPKSRIYRIIRKGEIRINKKRVKAEYKLKNGDSLRIPPIRISEKDKTIDLTKLNKVSSLDDAIIYESKQFILLNKPSGLAVHGGSGLSFGVIEAMRTLRPQEKFLELVHRLDKDTSGCLLIAKRRSYLNHFQDQLRARSMKKEYLAIVTGKWSNQFNRVTAPLQKNQPKSGERYVSVNESGKASETRFKCIKQYKNHSLIKAMPMTGRTHQIRVHAKYANCPLLGDAKYNDLVQDESLLKSLNIKTFLLHAAKLTFTIPDSEEVLTFEAPMPVKMKHVLTQLK